MELLGAWLIALAMVACALLVAATLLAGAEALIPALATEPVAGSDLPALVFVARAGATEIGLLLPAAVVLAWSARPVRRGLTKADVGVCAGALVAMLATNGAGSWLMARIGERYDGFPALDGSRGALAAAIGCAVLAAPIAEELFFREALLCRIFATASRPYALAITSLLFGGLHASAGGVVLFASLSILGLILGWVRLRTGSIGATIAVHAVHNALAFTFACAGRP